MTRIFLRDGPVASIDAATDKIKQSKSERTSDDIVLRNFGCSCAGRK